MNTHTKLDEHAVSGSRPRTSLWRTAGTAGIALALLGIAFLASVRKAPVANAAMTPPTVSTSIPLSRQINEWDTYIGRFEPSRTVDIRPRVSGQIVAVHFTDGATVRRGELLFTIDRRPFAAALAEANANLASARSELALARADAQRADNLVGDEAVSKSELDRLHARVQAGIAAVAAAQARVSARLLELDFTEVRAPIAGRVSYRRVDPGNLVATGEGTSGTLLTTVNALDPIYFVFDASEALYLKALRAKQDGAKTSAIEVRLQDETDYRWHGALDFTDNGLDPRSGTIRLRAVVPNRDLFLTPGMFGNMRLASSGTTTALLVPDAAIQTDQARKVVLTVTKAGIVEAKPVVLGPVVDGLRIVRSGLAPSDAVVVGGIQMATPGSKVLTKPTRIEPAAPARPAPAPAISGEATFAS
ncbi:efflux RND transporter periplasmic adaptor subunit [Cupriavidus plantarum]|uniref:efflux RND transporter periplasmic adaptor subunit n=1 Tax=Cupriavidus plantarum TaxID=942865 RepID=UPI000EB10901|nr:efflux RND transporter periplasmic adaptor subunit [Cupriavidus plantarum]